MERDPYGCQGFFLTISSVIGFIVDTVALAALLANTHLPGLSTIELPLLPKLNLGVIRLDWRDVTLVVLVYVAIAFALLSFQRWTSRRVGDPFDSLGSFLSAFLAHSFLVHLFVALSALWLVVFAPFGDTQLYLHLGEAWLVAFIGLVAASRRHSSLVHARTHEGKTQLNWNSLSPTKGNAWKVLLAYMSPLIAVLPAWALLEKGLSQSTWDLAITSVLKWGMLGTIASPVVWALPLVVVAVIGLPLVILQTLLTARRAATGVQYESPGDSAGSADGPSTAEDKPSRGR